MKRIKARWFRISDKIRFLLVGGFNAGVSYVIYSLLCVLYGADFYQKALAITWCVCSVISFCTQKFFVFRGKGVWIKEYLKCCTTWVVSYSINAGLLEIFVKKIGLNVFVAQIFATFSAAVFTYIMFKKFAFRKKIN